MTESKKLFAKFEWDDYRNDGDTNIVSEVHDLADAAKFGTQKRADFFTTYEIATVTVGGKTFSGDRDDKPGRHYLQQAKVYTAAEVLHETGATLARDAGRFDELLKELRGHGMSLPKDFDEAASRPNPLLEQCKTDGPDARYAKLRYKGFVRLEDGETAWDAKGKQLWPVQPPAPRAKPTGEFDL
jgi:hypothetical protein